MKRDYQKIQNFLFMFVVILAFLSFVGENMPIAFRKILLFGIIIFYLSALVIDYSMYIKNFKDYSLRRKQNGFIKLFLLTLIFIGALGTIIITFK